MPAQLLLRPCFHSEGRPCTQYHATKVLFATHALQAELAVKNQELAAATREAEKLLREISESTATAEKEKHKVAVIVEAVSKQVGGGRCCWCARWDRCSVPVGVSEMESRWAPAVGSEAAAECGVLLVQICPGVLCSKLLNGSGHQNGCRLRRLRL